MTELILLIILFSITYILERKAINKLTAFAGIILFTALILVKDIRIKEIGGEYISYILILVQLSAITILFGFIIMLFPQIYNLRLLTDLENKKYRVMKYVQIMILTFILIKLSLDFTSNPLAYGYGVGEGEYFTERIIKPDQSFNMSKLDNTLFLRKVAIYLYNYPLKLIMVTFILFVAVVNIFFLF